ncbi:MAG: tetratricopeptide repeat protein [Gallionella sp.]
MKLSDKACWIFSGLMLFASSVYAQSIIALNASDAGNGTTIIKVEFAQPLTGLPVGAGFIINNPDTSPRIVLDFPDTANGLGQSDQNFSAGNLRSANITQTGKNTRLVIHLDRVLAYNTKIDGNKLLIALEGNIAGEGAGGKAGQEAPKPAEAGIQVKKPAAPFMQFGLTPAKKLLGVLLNQATALIRGGKPADAYNLLEPKEAEYSGEIAFDYLLGMAALDSGKPDRATIAFERVLAVNPNFAGARLDLARAYFAMGSDDLAKKEFETVLNTQNPPEQVVAVIKKHLDAIEERQQAKIQQVTAYLETSVGHDDNITAATGDNTSGVAGILGMTRADLVSMFNYEPTGSSLHYSGTYTSVAGGVDFNRVVSEEDGISIFAGVDVKQRVYNKVSAMNT